MPATPSKDLSEIGGAAAGRALGLLVAAVLIATPGPAADSEECGVTAELVSPAVVGEVVFPHCFHSSDMGIPCEDCHHETSAESLDLPHPEYFEDFWIDCESCHRGGPGTAEPQSCGACHHAAPTEIADETLSSKVVIHQSCWECHPVGTGSEASSTCGFCHRLAAPEEHTAKEEKG